MRKIVAAILPRSEFSRNIATLMTGASFAQAIPILISPLLTRLYSPEDFGVFALLVAACSIFGVVANLRYDMAIMLPHKKSEAINVAALGLMVTLLISIALVILIFAVQLSTDVNFWNSRQWYWVFVVPLIIFFTGCYNVLNYYNSREKQYKSIARSNVIRSASMSLVQLMLGAFKVGSMGLIIGLVIGTVLSCLDLLINTLYKGVEPKKVRLSEIKKQARQFSQFPKYSAPAVFVNSSAQHIPSAFITAVFTSATLGQYYLVQRILGAPSMLIGASISQVYYQRATEEKNCGGSSEHAFKAALVRLVMVAFCVYGPLLFIIEDVFAIVFGEDWRVAGEYAKILLPMFCVRFVCAPMMFTFVVFEKQKQYFMINVALLAVVLFSSIAALQLGVDAKHYFYILSFGVASIYFVVLYAAWKIVSSEPHLKRVLS